MNINLSGMGVVLSLGALGALVYLGWTYTGHGPLQISIPAMIAVSALCVGIALLIATSWTRDGL